MHGHAAAATGKILVWGFHKFLENLPTMTLTRRRFLGKVIFVIKKVLVLISQWSKKLTALKVKLQVAGWRLTITLCSTKDVFLAVLYACDWGIFRKPELDIATCKSQDCLGRKENFSFYTNRLLENAFSKVSKKFYYKKYLHTLKFNFYNIFT